MLTPEQIKNWRTVLSVGSIGAYALLMPDSAIELLVSRLQAYAGRADDIPYQWEVRVRFKGDKQDMNLIAPEPLNPKKFSYNQMQKKCYQLLEKYPKIDTIRISEPGTPENFDDFCTGE